MAKPRVHEIAAELGVDASVVLTRLREMGEFAKGASSAIEPPVARRVFESFGWADRALVPPQGGRGPEAVPASLDLADVPQPKGTQNEAFDVLAADPEAPSSRQFGWHSDPVKPPRNPEVDRAIRRTESRFPIVADQRGALARLGSQIVYMAPALDSALDGSAIALVRFSGALESAFGFTREVMVLYSPYQDLQVRTYEAAFRGYVKEFGTH